MRLMRNASPSTRESAHMLDKLQDIRRRLMSLVQWLYRLNETMRHHDRRVCELLEANRSEVMRRRAAESEVDRLTAVHNRLDPRKIVHLADAETALRLIVANIDIHDDDRKADSLCRRIRDVAPSAIARINIDHANINGSQRDDTGRFMDLLIAGKVTEDNIDDFVSAWHTTSHTDSIYRFLGMTETEYAQWMRHPDCLPHLVQARRGHGR